MNDETMYYEENDIVSYEENNVVDTGEESILSKAGRVLFYAFLLLFPLWFLPTTIAQVEINKNFFAGIVLFGSLMLTLGGALQEGKVFLVRSRFFPLYLLFLISVFISSISSASPVASLWGMGFEAHTFLNFVFAGVALFLSSLVLKESQHLKTAFFFLALSSLITALFFFVQSVFGVDIFWWNFAKDRGFNLFGSWNTLAMFLGASAAMFIPFIGSKASSFLKLSGLWFLLLLLGVFFTNFNIVWIGLGTISLFFVALALSLRQQKTQMFAVALFVLMFSVLFVLLSDKLGTYFVNFGRPSEISPLFSDSMNIVKHSLSASPVFGSGPSTFAVSWDQFKDARINNSPFWQVRFSNGSSAFLTLISETGVLGLVLLVGLMGLFLWQGIRTMGVVVGDEAPYARALFAGGLFLVIMWVLYPLSFALILLTFVMIGMFLVALRDMRLLAPMHVDLFKSKERGFVFSLLIIFLLVGSIASIYYQITRYLGQVAFARAIDVYNSDGAVNGAEAGIKAATELDSKQDRFYRTYAQLELVKLQRVLSDQKMDNQEKSKQFVDIFASAKSAAEAAININKTEAANYRTLGQIYESAIPVDPDNALTFAVDNYEKALKLSPADPSIDVDAARAYLTYADTKVLRGGGTTSRKIAADAHEKAAEYLVKATELKADYAQAHFTLAQLYALDNKLDEAIDRAQATATLAPRDTGVLFQLGLLYYRKEKLDLAGQAFKRAVDLAPNFSNARYFLGLVYDRANMPKEALEQFQKIAELNPDNKEVAAVIEALQAGKKAVDVLSQPPPEERKEAPVNDTAASGVKKKTTTTTPTKGTTSQ